jgi:hypothetical protein
VAKGAAAFFSCLMLMRSPCPSKNLMQSKLKEACGFGFAESGEDDAATSFECSIVTNRVMLWPSRSTPDGGSMRNTPSIGGQTENVHARPLILQREAEAKEHLVRPLTEKVSTSGLQLNPDPGTPPPPRGCTGSAIGLSFSSIFLSAFNFPIISKARFVSAFGKISNSGSLLLKTNTRNSSSVFSIILRPLIPDFANWPINSSFHLGSNRRPTSAATCFGNGKNFGSALPPPPPACDMSCCILQTATIRNRPLFEGRRPQRAATDAQRRHHCLQHCLALRRQWVGAVLGPLLQSPDMLIN